MPPSTAHSSQSVRPKSYFATAILAMVTPPGMIVGIPAGIWALIVLSRQEIKAAFEEVNRTSTTHAAAAEPRFSRPAIWGAAWALLFFFVVILLLLSHMAAPPSIESIFWHFSRLGYWRGFMGPSQMELLSYPVGLLGFMAPLGTTILGLVSLTQIRHSRGRYYGLGLGLFDVLLFPLLVLNGLIVWGWTMVADFAFGGMAGPVFYTLPVLGLMIASCGLVNWLIIRTAWRAVNRPVLNGDSESDAAFSSSPPERATASKSAAVVLVLALLLPAVPV